MAGRHRSLIRSDKKCYDHYTFTVEIIQIFVINLENESRIVLKKDTR